MRRIGYRHQRTLAKPAQVLGTGFITGAKCRLRFHPAPVDTGLVFVRADLPNRPMIPATSKLVSNTARRTTLGPADTGITLTEHVLAALAGLRIDNCYIELDCVEPPGLDGSAAPFVAALTEAGAALQSARRAVWDVTEPLVVKNNGATIALHPADPAERNVLRVSYVLDYGPTSVIPRQAFTVLLSPDTFAREVASCRTFVLASEALALRAEGIGTHLTPQDLIVFGPQGPYLNTLRFADEPARHKVLDVIGDLALTGFDVVGHLVAYRSGHALNVALADALVDAAAQAVMSVPMPARPAGRRRVAA